MNFTCLKQLFYPQRQKKVFVGRGFAVYLKSFITSSAFYRLCYFGNYVLGHSWDAPD